MLLTVAQKINAVLRNLLGRILGGGASFGGR